MATVTELPGLNFYESVNDAIIDRQYKYDDTHTQNIRKYLVHTPLSWGLTSPGIPVSPEVNTQYVEVPGSNTFINLSKVLTGDITYGLREGEFTLKYIGERRNLKDAYNTLTTNLNGRELYMVSDEDDTEYYHGLFEVGPLKSSRSKITVSIKYKLDPFRIEMNATRWVTDFDGSSTENLSKVSEFIDLDRGNQNGSFFRCSEGFDFTDSTITAIQFRLPVSLYNEAPKSVQIKFTDINGNSHTWYETKSVTKDRDTIADCYIKEFKNSGDYPTSIDMSQIVSITSTWRYLEIWVKTAGTVMSVTCCSDKICPLISVPSTNMFMLCGGKKYTFTETDGEYLEDFYLPAGTKNDVVTLTFGSTDIEDSGTIRVSCCRRWL